MSTGSRHDEPEQQGQKALYPVEEVKRLYSTISELRAEVEALRRRQDGVVERVSLYDSERVLKWMHRNGLVSIRIDGDQVLIEIPKESER